MNTFKNILIAEDDKEDYDFLVEALQSINPEFSIKKAVNGLQVMGYLKSLEVPDIIFLDLNMPIRNGIATLQLIKAVDDFKNIPIVIYSTSRYFKAIDEAYKNEAHYYIVKPTEMPVLINHLLNVFNLLTADTARPGKADFVIGIKTGQEGVAG
jgi:CheY-like chemotaxis protein